MTRDFSESSSPSSSNWWPWASAALGVILAAVFAHFAGAGIVDDAYTGLRHSKNLALGHGPVFNPGERVEGYTSILWTYVPGLLGVFTSLLVELIVGLSFLSAGALAWALHKAHKPGSSLESRADALGIALGTVALPGCFFWAASGMDSVLFAALIVIALISAIEDLDAAEGLRVSGRTIVWLALASLTRMEALLLAAWVGAAFTLLHGKLDRHWLKQILLPFGWLAALWVIITFARLHYFGELLPNTFYAKLTPDIGARVVRGLRYWARWGFAHAPLLLVVAGIGVLSARKQALDKRAAVLLGGGWFLYCAYVVWVGGDHFAMHRFLLPATALAAALFSCMWQGLRECLREPARHMARLAFVLAVAASAFLSFSLDGAAAQRETRFTHQWKRIGQWVKANTPPDAVIALIPIGAVSYFADRQVVDMLGIVDRQIAHHGMLHPGAAPAHGRYLTDYVFDRNPDLVLYGGSAFLRAAGFNGVQFRDRRKINQRYGFALYDFVNDARCAQRYEHILVPLPGGSFVEMQKRKDFELQVDYRRAPEGW